MKSPEKKLAGYISTAEVIVNEFWANHGQGDNRLYGDNPELRGYAQEALENHTPSIHIPRMIAKRYLDAIPARRTDKRQTVKIHYCGKCNGYIGWLPDDDDEETDFDCIACGANKNRIQTEVKRS